MHAKFHKDRTNNKKKKLFTSQTVPLKKMKIFEFG